MDKYPLLRRLYVQRLGELEVSNLELLMELEVAKSRIEDLREEVNDLSPEEDDDERTEAEVDGRVSDRGNDGAESRGGGSGDTSGENKDGERPS